MAGRVKIKADTEADFVLALRIAREAKLPIFMESPKRLFFSMEDLPPQLEGRLAGLRVRIVPDLQFVPEVPIR